MRVNATKAVDPKTVDSDLCFGEILGQPLQVDHAHALCTSLSDQHWHRHGATVVRLGPSNTDSDLQALRGLVHEFYMPALQQQQDWGNADAEASEEFLGVLEKFSGTLSEAVCLHPRPAFFSRSRWAVASPKANLDGARYVCGHVEQCGMVSWCSHQSASTSPLGSLE